MKPDTDQGTITAILDYWFADIGDGFEFSDQHALWYGGSVAADREIQARFGAWVEEALVGGLSQWTESASGTLAVVLLLDQFARNIYRGSARAFAGDTRARALVDGALTQGIDRQLSVVQRTFFYMPLEHSEQLADQDRCVALFQQLLEEVPEQGREVIQNSLDYALQHRDIIVQFGRFPHRNQVLGRESTAQERVFLDGGGARFGQ